MKVRVDFLARDQQAVLPEMGLRVRFLSDRAPAGLETGDVREKLAVPLAAVQSGHDSSYVWVVRDNEAPARRATGREVRRGSRLPAASTPATRSWSATG